MLLRLRSRSIDLASPCVMGVLNVTPDSFSDGGLHRSHSTAIDAGARMVEEGAAIVDVGGESTRPGAHAVALQEELERVVPVIEGLARRVDVALSVDTSKPEVMAAAIAAGAHLVNDVRAMRAPDALAIAARAGVAVCVMHMRGEPATMQIGPVYDDVVAEVRGFLVERVAACRAAGIADDSICVDPGIGFGKSYAHNLQLLQHLGEFTGLGGALLIGVSRKSLLGIITGRPPAERAVGSATLAALCVERGARIVRAHDVAATADALKIASALAGRS